jgi:hypothetical protein
LWLAIYAIRGEGIFVYTYRRFGSELVPVEFACPPHSSKKKPVLALLKSLKYRWDRSRNMSVSSVGGRGKKKKGGGSTGARRSAMKDATPDAQPRAPIKRMLEDDEGPAAESDEDDD